MSIVYNDTEVRAYMKRILSTGIENPVLVDKYMKGMELEVDVISDGKDVLIPGVSEFIKEIDVERGVFVRLIPGFFPEV